MTVRLLCARGKYPANAIVTLDAGTEAGLVTAKMASTDMTGGVPYVELPSPNQIVASDLVYDASGTLIGMTTIDGKIQPLGGGLPYTQPAAPIIGTATAGNGTVTITWTAGATGGLPILAYYVELSSGFVLLAPAGATSTTFYGVPNGANVSGTVVAINLVGPSPASAKSNVVTPSAGGNSLLGGNFSTQLAANGNAIFA